MSAGILNDKPVKTWIQLADRDYQSGGVSCLHSNNRVVYQVMDTTVALVLSMQT